MNRISRLALAALASTSLTLGVLAPASAVEAPAQRYSDQIGVSVASPNAALPTNINVNLLYTQHITVGQTAPTVLLGPGFGFTGDTNRSKPTDSKVGMIGVKPLLDAGYNVVTWDPRGFGKSGGDVALDNPLLEGQDAKSIVDWLVEQPGIALEDPKPGVEGKDPVLGMSSGSYGGGIQWVLAALDPRVDAITPAISWNSLQSTLLTNGQIKQGWGVLLCGLGGMGVLGNTPAASVVPKIGTNRAFEPGLKNACQAFWRNQATPTVIDYARAVGPDFLLDQVKVPTLLLQGTVDTLFPLSQADANAKVLAKNGVPYKMVWFCGGHGLCSTGYHHEGYLDHAVLQWLDKYLKGKDFSDPVFADNQFIFPDQYRNLYAASTYPAQPAVSPQYPDGKLRAVNARGGRMLLSPFAISGMLVAAGAAPVAIQTQVPEVSSPVLVAGTPQLSFTYRGYDRNPSYQDTFVYAQLIDSTTGWKVWGNQATPIPVRLDGKTRQVQIDIEQVAGMVKPGMKLRLQLTPSSALYAKQRTGTFININNIDLALPLVGETVQIP